MLYAHETVSNSGRLRRAFQPAIYADATFLVEYWLAEQLEGPKELDSDEPLATSLADLLKSNKNIQVMGKIRTQAVHGSPGACLVTTIPAFLELVEWYSDASFRQLVSEYAGARLIHKKSKKELGDLLARVIGASSPMGSCKANPAYKRIHQETCLVPSFATAHGLQGILFADIKNFFLPFSQLFGTQKAPCLYDLAYLQLGVADILHIAIASHLGCKYIASFDVDFRRARKLISAIGIELLPTPAEVLGALKHDFTKKAT